MPEYYIVDAKTGAVRGSVVHDSWNETKGVVEDEYNGFVRDLIESNKNVTEGKELLVRALEQLYLLGYDSGLTNPEIEQLVTDIKFYLKRGKLNGT